MTPGAPHHTGCHSQNQPVTPLRAPDTGPGPPPPPPPVPPPAPPPPFPVPRHNRPPRTTSGAVARPVRALLPSPRRSAAARPRSGAAMLAEGPVRRLLRAGDGARSDGRAWLCRERLGMGRGEARDEAGSEGRAGGGARVGRGEPSAERFLSSFPFFPHFLHFPFPFLSFPPFPSPFPFPPSLLPCCFPPPFPPFPTSPSRFSPLRSRSPGEAGRLRGLFPRLFPRFPRLFPRFPRLLPSIPAFPLAGTEP